MESKGRRVNKEAGYILNQARGPYWENIGLRSFQYGPRAARSVQKRPWADVLQVRSRASDYYTTENVFYRQKRTTERIKNEWDSGRTFKELRHHRMCIFKKLAKLFKIVILILFIPRQPYSFLLQNHTFGVFLPQQAIFLGFATLEP